MSRFFAGLAFGLLSLASAVVAAPADDAQSDLPAGVFLTRSHLGDGPVVSNSSNTAAGRPIVLATRGFAAIGKVLVAFTDAELHPFYTLPAKCEGDCLTRWHPVSAWSQAKPVGEWSIVARDDGARQWALRGRLLFTYAKEAPFKDDPHLPYLREPPGRLQQVAGEGVDGAVVAEADPNEQMKLPAGAAVLQFDQAPGMVLSIAATGTPVYAFAGKDERELKDFRPYAAAMLSQPVGDFKIRERADGIRRGS